MRPESALLSLFLEGLELFSLYFVGDVLVLDLAQLVKLVRARQRVEGRLLTLHGGRLQIADALLVLGHVGGLALALVDQGLEGAVVGLLRGLLLGLLVSPLLSVVNKHHVILLHRAGSQAGLVLSKNVQLPLLVPHLLSEDLLRGLRGQHLGRELGQQFLLHFFPSLLDFLTLKTQPVGFEESKSLLDLIKALFCED